MALRCHFLASQESIPWECSPTDLNPEDNFCYQIDTVVLFRTGLHFCHGAGTKAWGHKLLAELVRE
jgi:hypothetical protein